MVRSVDRRRITQPDYERLLAFRTGLRQFLHWSAEQAEAAGLTPAQHQLLLAIQGHPGRDAPMIGDLAESLLLRHHSVVGLLDRAVRAGLVVRRRDPADGRVVRVSLSAEGAARLAALSATHLEEIRRVATSLGQFTSESGPPLAD